MNSPEAQEAASKMLGHCGDAETQDVMNACYAMEFKKSDDWLNQVYRDVLRQLSSEDQQRVRAAQRAWLYYRDLHCGAVGAVQVGGGSLEPTVVYGCRTGLTVARAKEIENDYRAAE